MRLSSRPGLIRREFDAEGDFHNHLYLLAPASTLDKRSRHTVRTMDSYHPVVSDVIALHVVGGAKRILVVWVAGGMRSFWQIVGNHLTYTFRGNWL
jgi:hypothetical protein